MHIQIQIHSLNECLAFFCSYFTLPRQKTESKVVAIGGKEVIVAGPDDQNTVEPVDAAKSEDRDSECEVLVTREARNSQVNNVSQEPKHEEHGSNLYPKVTFVGVPLPNPIGQ